MKIYNDILREIMDKGVDREGRNGSTRGLFTLQMRFDMAKGFPAVTTKKLAFNAVKGELLWFLEGSGDDNRLKEIMGKDHTIFAMMDGVVQFGKKFGKTTVSVVTK